MGKRLLSIFCVILALSFIVLSFSYAAETQQSVGAKAKNFWQRLFNYPANVTKDTTNIVADAGKGAVTTVANEVKTIGEVTSGNVEKAPELVTEPVKATAEGTYSTVKDTVNMPVDAAKESAPAAETK